MFKLIKQKCDQLKITSYEGGNKQIVDHEDVRLIGCLIAYYESEMVWKERAIKLLIHSPDEFSK